MVSPVSSDFIFLGWYETLHVINTIIGHCAHFWIFWQEFFGARKRGSRLMARGSGSQARKIATPEHSEPRFFFQVFAKNRLMKIIFEEEKKFDSRT